MIIVIKDYYRIRISPLAPAFFDLSSTVISKTGKNKGQSHEKIIAYSIPLSRCIEIIAGLENSKLEKDVEMHEFLIEYKKLLEELKIRIINQVKEKTNE